MNKNCLVDKTFILWLDLRLFVSILILFIFISYVHKKFLYFFFTAELRPSKDKYLEKSKIFNMFHLHVARSFNQSIILLVLMFLNLLRFLLFIILIFLALSFFLSFHVIIFKIKMINV